LDDLRTILINFLGAQSVVGRGENGASAAQELDNLLLGGVVQKQTFRSLNDELAEGAGALLRCCKRADDKKGEDDETETDD